MLVPYLMIAPAPRNPMPVTIWAEMRLGIGGAVPGMLGKAVDRENGEDGRTEGDEHVRPHAGRMAVDFPLES